MARCCVLRIRPRGAPTLRWAAAGAACRTARGGASPAPAPTFTLSCSSVTTHIDLFIKPMYLYVTVSSICNGVFADRMTSYEHVRRFLSPSVPLREAHLHNGTRLTGDHLDVDSFLKHIVFYYASTLG